MKKTRTITATALLTFALLCIAPPMASAGDLGFKSVSQATFAVKGKQRWWHKIRQGNFKNNDFKKKSTKNAVDNPEPITGMLALAAAGVGGAAMRKRKKQDQDQE